MPNILLDIVIIRKKNMLFYFEKHVLNNLFFFFPRNFRRFITITDFSDKESNSFSNL